MPTTKRAAEAAPGFPYVVADTECLSPQIWAWQARVWTRRCSINFELASAVVPLLHSEVAQ
jgi:hypothetical protein